MTQWLKQQIIYSAIITAVVLGAALVMLMCGGCAVIKVNVNPDGSWDGRAYTLFKTLEVPPFIIGGSNQFETMGAYRSGTDIEKAGTLIGAAVKAAGYGGK